MVSMSFSISPEKMKQIYEYNQKESYAAGGKDVPISATITLLVQRGLAYTQLLAEKVQEIKTPEEVAVKRKYRNKEW